MTGTGWGSKIGASTPDNFNYPALEMSLQQAHPRAGRTLLDWLPLPITLSRLWMYSHRASSMTRALFRDGMAGKSKMPRLLTAGKRAARIRRCTMLWWWSMSSSSERRSR